MPEQPGRGRGMSYAWREVMSETLKGLEGCGKVLSCLQQTPLLTCATKLRPPTSPHAVAANSKLSWHQLSQVSLAQAMGVIKQAPCVSPALRTTTLPSCEGGVPWVQQISFLCLSPPNAQLKLSHWDGQAGKAHPTPGQSKECGSTLVCARTSVRFECTFRATCRS